jgi:hypothetical protein
MIQKLLFILLLSQLFTSAAAAQDIINVTKGQEVPFDGVLLSVDAAAKVLVDKQFSNEESDLRLQFELKRQEEKYKLLLDFKDIELSASKDKYEQMMILKIKENDRLEKLIIKQNPNKEPWMTALGFGIGTATSLGIFAISTEIVK